MLEGHWGCKMVQGRGGHRAIYAFYCVGFFFKRGSGVHPRKCRKRTLGQDIGVYQEQYDTGTRRFQPLARSQRMTNGGNPEWY